VFEKIVAACLAHRLAVLVATLVVFVWGVYSFQGLTIEAFPDPTDTQVQIITSNPGQPAEEMERQVSIPIERAVNGMPGLSRVRSINLFGLSYITLTFRDGVDAYFARAQTGERLRLVDLPEGIRSELGSLSTPIGEIYRYTLTSPSNDPLELRTVQDWVVRPRLLQVDGVADVVSYGGLLKEIEVRPDPVAMAAKRLTMGDLEDALKKASINASGGVMERGSEQLVIRSEGMFADVNDVGRVAVGSRGGTPILLSDVASVQVGWMPRQGIVGRADDHDVVQGIIMMRRGENPSSVLERVRDKVTELNEQVLVDGAKVSVFYDRTELVAKTLETVGKNLLEGALLVVTVLFVFLLDLRAALIVASLIPMALLSAFIYLRSRGMAANLLSMGAVDFGIIVDGAVVIVESIAMRMVVHAEQAPEVDEAGQPLDVPARIQRAVIEVARPTFFALLIIMAGYLPIFLLERVEGRMFAPMAHTVVAALGGSLLFSVTLVPVLATFAFAKPRPHHESPILVWSSRAYVPTLRAALRRPLVVVLCAVASLGLAYRILSTRGSEFLPEINEGAMYLTFTLPANTSLTEGRRLEPLLTSIIDGFPQVESRISQLGRPEDGTDPKLANNLEVFVKLRPATQWPKDTPTLGALMDRMNGALSAIPGIEVNFSQPIRDNVNESIAGQQGQVALKIFSNNMDDLTRAADEAKTTLAGIRGVADLGVVKSGDLPQVQVKPRRETLGRFGMTMMDVQSFLSTALAGRAVGTLWDGDKSFDVVLRLPEEKRDTVELLANLRIPTPQGALVPLSSVADVKVGYGRAAINRENGQRYVGIRMNVRNRDMGSFVDEARKAVDARVAKKPGMTLSWGGEFESKERAMARLTVVVPVALLITFGLLFNAFRSVSLALLVLLNVPFAMVGGAVGLWAFDMPVSIAAAVGFIALVGQASLNGVLVLSAIEARRAEGLSIHDAIVQGANDRLRAVLMTAALAALGLVPAAFSKAMGAEMQRPMAVVIVGGTVSAALLTLLVLPVMYSAVMPLFRRMGPLAEVPAVGTIPPPEA
jgi:heavy metal efflux system protein